MPLHHEQAWTVTQIADMCQVAHATVRNWIKEGKLEAYSLPGGHYRVRGPALAEFMSQFGIPIPDSVHAAANAEQVRVLVIDDEQAFCNLAMEVLADDEGRFTVASASTGAKGLMLAGSLNPDIIVLDIMMPGMNGVEVCREVRNIEHLARTKIVVCTAYGDSPEVQAALDAGADACLFKPVSPKELRKTILDLARSLASEP